MSLLLKLPPGKSLPSLVFSFYLLRLGFLSVNLLSESTWNTTVMSVLALLMANWICWISYRNESIQVLVFNSLLLLKSSIFSKWGQSKAKDFIWTGWICSPSLFWMKNTCCSGNCYKDAYINRLWNSLLIFHSVQRGITLPLANYPSSP